MTKPMYGQTVTTRFLLVEDDPIRGSMQPMLSVELYDHNMHLVAQFVSPECRNEAIGFGLAAKRYGIVKWFYIIEGNNKPELF